MLSQKPNNSQECFGAVAASQNLFHENNKFARTQRNMQLTPLLPPYPFPLTPQFQYCPLLPPLPPNFNVALFALSPPSPRNFNVGRDAWQDWGDFVFNVLTGTGVLVCGGWEGWELARANKPCSNIQTHAPACVPPNIEIRG